MFAAETFCFPAAILDCPEFFAGQDIVWFADNEASVSTIIRGACTIDDIHDLAEATMDMIALHRCWLWVDWIDSNSNPADELSGQGSADPFSSNMAVTN